MMVPQQRNCPMTHFSEFTPSQGDPLLYIIKIALTYPFLLFNLCYVLHKRCPGCNERLCLKKNTRWWTRNKGIQCWPLASTPAHLQMRIQEYVHITHTYTHKASLENLTISGFIVFDFKVALCMLACTCVCMCVCLHVSVPYMRFCRGQRRTLDVIFYHFTPSSLDRMCLFSLPSHPHPTPIRMASQQTQKSRCLFCCGILL